MSHATKLSLRRYFAPPSIASGLPFSSHELHWRDNAGIAVARIDLPDLPAQHIIVPSFACTTAPAGFRFRLSTNNGTLITPWFGCSRESQPASGEELTGNLDYFDTADAARGAATLDIEVAGEVTGLWLAAVSVRPRTQPTDLLTPPVPENAPPLNVPPRCQRDLPADIAMRTCSPTCISMVLDFYGESHDAMSVLRYTQFPFRGGNGESNNIYGVWPQNIWAASRFGILGAAIAFDGWQEVTEYLRNGMPVTTGIRFDAGGLPGAPLARSDGHLVVLTGIHDGYVNVNDPAAFGAEQVVTRYPVPEFAECFLRHRGVGYVLIPAR